MLNILNLLKEVEFDRIMTAQAAGTGDTLDTDPIDFSDCESATIVVLFGAIVAGCVLTIKAQQGSASNLSDAADLEGTSQTVPDTADNKMAIIEIRQPREQYVRARITRATQNATIDGVLVIKHGKKIFPVTQGSDVVSSELHISPPEGTA